MRIALLAPMGMRCDPRLLRELGIDLHLAKPISESDLLDAIMSLSSASTGSEGSLIARQSPGEEHVAGRPIPPLRVLVAEDNCVNQVLTRRLLEKEGDRVTIADDGEAALQAFQAESFDLVLMDVQMPEMDGYQTTHAIRQLKRPGRRVPIIALTANAMSADRARCLA